MCCSETRAYMSARGSLNACGATRTFADRYVYFVTLIVEQLQFFFSFVELKDDETLLSRSVCFYIHVIERTGVTISTLCAYYKAFIFGRRILVYIFGRIASRNFYIQSLYTVRLYTEFLYSEIQS